LKCELYFKLKRREERSREERERGEREDRERGGED